MAPDQGTVDAEKDYSSPELGILGWISLIGFVVMGTVSALAAATDASTLLSPSMDLTIAGIAGIGALLLWLGNDPTVEGRPGP
jgi:hypothetical protein